MAENWITASTEAIFDEVVGWRRHFHAHPELSYQEVQTAARVAELLRSFGAEEVTEHIGGGNGVTALIHGTGSGKGSEKCIALRADMDALSVTEETGLPFASQNCGVMHACGHDGHMAMLLGTARILCENRDKFAGTVKLIFQPAEEPAPEGGAQAMIDAGVLENPKVDAIMGLHLWSGNNRYTGEIMVKKGVASTLHDIMKIEVFGRAGHGSAPHLNIDALVVGCKIVEGIQTIVSRQIDPFDTAVMSVGTFQSGTADNVTSGYTKMGVSIRTLSVEMREHIRECVKKLLAGMETIYGVTTKLDYQEGYISIMNDSDVVDTFIEACNGQFGEGVLKIAEKPETWSEDFSAYCAKVPGMFAIVGASYTDGRDIYSNHNSHFDWDENAMKYGMQAELASVIRFFER